MKVIDVKSKVNESRLLKIFAAAYSHSTGENYNDVLSMINQKFDQKLNEIGEKIVNNQLLDKEKSKELKTKDLEDFLDGKKVIKED